MTPTEPHVPERRQGERRDLVTDSEWTNGEIGRAIQRIEADVHEIKGDVKEQNQTFATKTDLAQLRADHGRELGEIKDRLEGRNIPWPHVVSAICTIGMLAMAIYALGR